MSARRAEADEFWAERDWPAISATTSVWSCRQALAGMLWSKQYYALDVERWLAEHGADPLGGRRRAAQPATGGT